MRATKNGWTVEGTPREIAELIGITPACSLYETPEWNKKRHDTIYKTGKEALEGFELMHKAEAIRHEQAKLDKQMEECKELERSWRGEGRMSKKYINADALIADLQDRYKSYSWDDEPEQKQEVAHWISWIYNLDAADVRENVRGEWIYKDGKTYCSNCFSPYGVRYDGENNFCPNCGADMRGEMRKK